MSLSPELMYAILAMDAYNRGYNPGLVYEGNSVGTATVTQQSETAANSPEVNADFYAVSYDTEYGKVIAYRGTDNPGFELAFVDWPIAFNDDYDEAQVHLANRFYNEVAGAGGNSITLTGHSLGGALAGFTGMVNSEPIVSVAPIDFVPAFLNFKALIDQYLLVKDTPQASTDEIYVPGKGDVNTVQFAVDTLTAMGIDLNAIPTLQTQITNYTGMHLSGEVAEFSRSALTPSTPILDGFLQHMGSIVGDINAHSASLSVILKYAEDEFVAKGAAALHFTTITEELFPGLFDDEIGILAGSAGQISDADANAIMREAIAYSAIDEGSLVFGNTGIRAFYDDANEIGKLVLDGKIPKAYGDPIPGIAEGIVQFAAQMALNEVDYKQHGDWEPEKGFLRLNADETVMTVLLAKELWNLGGDDPNRAVKIKGIQTIYDEFFNQEEEASDILAAIEQLYAQHDILNDASVIDRIDFELGSGPLTVTLAEYVEDLSVLPIVYNPTTTSLFVALDVAPASGLVAAAAAEGSGGMDDVVDGTRDNNVIVGGDGDDILYGRLGKDILLGGRGRDRFIDLVTEVAPDGRTNEDDIYYGEPSDESLLGLFFAWLNGTQVEDTVEYRLKDERDGEAELPGRGLEIASLRLSTVGEAEAIELAITDLNSGKTGTDHLVDIDKVILSEQRDEVIVQPTWLEVPLWIDLGKATENRMAA